MVLKTRIVTDRTVLRYMIGNPDFCERLASALEIEIDPGESAGDYVNSVAQEMLDQDRLKVAQSHVDRIEEEIARRTGSERDQ